MLGRFKTRHSSFLFGLDFRFLFAYARDVVRGESTIGKLKIGSL